MVTPNSLFVWEPQLGQCTLQMCENYRFGASDPCQWLQMYSPDTCHFVAIPQKESRSMKEYNVLFLDLQSSFQRDVNPSIEGLGHFQPAVLHPFMLLFDSVQM